MKCLKLSERAQVDAARDARLSVCRFLDVLTRTQTAQSFASPP